MSKKNPIVDLVQIVQDMGFDDIDNYVERELEDRFDGHYKHGKLADPMAAISDAKQFQDITAAAVAKHPAFKQMVERLAKGIARGARKQSLEFQLSLVFDD